MKMDTDDGGCSTTQPPTVVDIEALITRIFEADCLATRSRDAAAQAAVDQRKAEAEKVKMESLSRSTQAACRDLQHSTKVLEEDVARLREESLTRREKLTGKFDKTIEDITAKMGTQTEEV